MGIGAFMSVSAFQECRGSLMGRHRPRAIRLREPEVQEIWQAGRDVLPGAASLIHGLLAVASSPRRCEITKLASSSRPSLFNSAL